MSHFHPQGWRNGGAAKGKSDAELIALPPDKRKFIVPRWYLDRMTLTHKQAELINLVCQYFETTGEPCPITFLAKSLNLHHETVRERVAQLFERGFVLAPGSPVTPKAPRALPRESPHGQVVYMLLDTRARLVKIGRSGHLEARLRTLGHGQPHIVLLGAFDQHWGHGQLSETAWHRRFASARVTGEWFALTTEIRAEIRARFGVEVTDRQ